MSIFKRKKKETETGKIELKAYISGKVIPMEEVEDEVFSSKVLGDGIAIEPNGNTVCAPCEGVVSTVAEGSLHAVGITLDNGAELLIHEGIDTVSMNGEGFQAFVKPGERVKEGQKLLQFDPKLILEKGYKKTCILVLMGTEGFRRVEYRTGMDAVQSETVVAELEK